MVIVFTSEMEIEQVTSNTDVISSLLTTISKEVQAGTGLPSTRFGIYLTIPAKHNRLNANIYKLNQKSLYFSSMPIQSSKI